MNNKIYLRVQRVIQLLEECNKNNVLEEAVHLQNESYQSSKRLRSAIDRSKSTFLKAKQLIK